MSRRLAGRVAIITGGSRGLGREMALAIADAGADVVLTGRNEASLEKTAADIRTLGREAFPIVADIGDPAGCEAACQKALENHRPIDILINNVGGRRVPTREGVPLPSARAPPCERSRSRRGTTAAPVVAMILDHGRGYEVEHSVIGFALHIVIAAMGLC